MSTKRKTNKYARETHSLARLSVSMVIRDDTSAIARDKCPETHIDNLRNESRRPILSACLLFVDDCVSNDSQCNVLLPAKFDRIEETCKEKSHTEVQSNESQTEKSEFQTDNFLT